MTGNNFLGSRDFAAVLSDLQMTCLDIGARGGFVEDLLPLAPWVDAIGFEPDREECEKLNLSIKNNSEPWRSLRYLPVALGENHDSRTLNIYHKRGCSSFFDADLPLVKEFGRDDYFELEGTFDLSTISLDKAAQAYNFTEAVFIKTDVQGAELEIFQSAPNLLGENVLAIRTEIEFMSIYKGQPLFSEVEIFLRKMGFMPMGFVQLDHWRRSTRCKHPNISDGPIPYSRGQIVHGDMLFFRNPAQMNDETPEALKALLKMAFLALVYEYVDHAHAILTRPAVMRYLSKYKFDIENALHEVSCYLYHKYKQSMRHRRKTNVKNYIISKIR